MTNLIAEYLEDNQPEWITEQLDYHQVEDIATYGCASGSYMPAVTYYQALQTMNEHGDEVLDYLNNYHGDELPDPPSDSSWGGIAVHYLSLAVECWCHSALCEMEGLEYE